MAPRIRIGDRLIGDVLEVGPGHQPFPTAPGARVVYADKSVPGGRDATWPELAGEPRGPRAHHDVDLDVTGLDGIASGSLDAVIAAHVIEHLADPVGALIELERVVRPGGTLVLVLPERRMTFDAPRPPTPLRHVLDEHRDGVVEVSDAHIVEFCEAIYGQPPIHPPDVREWHDPSRLDAARLDLHRRRSIHVHCWSAEEFASLLTGLLALGLIEGRLADVYVHDDPGVGDIEFGFALAKVAGEPGDAALAFVDAWVDAILTDPARDLDRISTFTAALARDLPEVGVAAAADLVARPAAQLAARLREQRAHAAALDDALTSREAELDAITRSRSYRLASLARHTRRS